MALRRAVRTFTVAIAVGLTTTVVAVVAGHQVAPELSTEVLRWHRGLPKYTAPELVEVGGVDAGTPALATFTAANDGYGPLVIDDIRTGCNCRGLERRTAVGYEPVRELTLQPGERADLAVRFVPAGRPSQETRFGVRFRTSDPDAPEAALVVVSHIRGRLTAHPPTVIETRIPLGRPRVIRVDIRDTGDHPVRVGRVTPAGLSGLLCRFVPTDGGGDPSSDGALRGHIELTYTAARAGTVNGYLDVVPEEPSARSIQVPVTLSAESAVRLLPSIVRLPRNSDSGRLYTAVCLLRPTAGAADTAVSLVSAPPALDVAVSPPADGAPGRVSVTVKDGFRTPDKLVDYTVALAAVVGGERVELALPVTVTPAD